MVVGSRGGEGQEPARFLMLLLSCSSSDGPCACAETRYICRKVWRASWETSLVTTPKRCDLPPCAACQPLLLDSPISCASPCLPAVHHRYTFVHQCLPVKPSSGSPQLLSLLLRPVLNPLLRPARCHCPVPCLDPLAPVLGLSFLSAVQDLVIPPMTSAEKYRHSPLVGAPAQERSIFAFFKGGPCPLPQWWCLCQAAARTVV